MTGGYPISNSYNCTRAVIGRFAFDRWHIADQFHDAGLLYQSTHSSVAVSTASMRRHGSSHQINSGLYKPLMVLLGHGVVVRVAYAVD